jgi:hypothetical protein
MSNAYARVRGRLDRWKQRAAGGKVAPTDEAVEEHRRYEESVDQKARQDEADALQPDESEMRHDTPEGSEQTPG